MQNMHVPSHNSVFESSTQLFSLYVGWLVVLGPLRKYFSPYRANSQREGEREEK